MAPDLQEKTILSFQVPCSGPSSPPMAGQPHPYLLRALQGFLTCMRNRCSFLQKVQRSSLRGSTLPNMVSWAFYISSTLLLFVTLLLYFSGKPPPPAAGRC